MDQNNIKPEKITKPIQLLAVWLLGLILLVSALITASATVKEPTWIPGLFSISAVAIIPLFVILIFLLQTKFRPQMQEDEYYARFLNKDTMNTEVLEQTNETMFLKIDEKFIELSKITKDQITLINSQLAELSPKNGDKKPKVNTSEKKFDVFIQETKNIIQLNRSLPNATEITKILQDRSLNIDHFFGKEKPEIFLLSFGKKVEFDTLRFMIDKLIGFGLSHLKVIRESNRNSIIYIGSYAYKADMANCVLLSEGMIKKINKCKTTTEIWNLIATV